MQLLAKIKLITYATAVSFGLHAAPEVSVQIPKVIIKTIKNNTRYNLAFTDRLSGATITLPAGKTVEARFKVDNSRSVVIRGSMAEALAKEAQYVIKKLDTVGNAIPQKEVYLNLSALEGGINHGDGLICGARGTIALKFLMAGRAGGCIMSTRKLTPCSQAEFNLELSMDEDDAKKDIFRLLGDAQLIVQ
jgi:hypothetical protein